MAEFAVGLIGYGLAGSVFHAPLIAATPGLRLAAVVTRDPVRADEVRAKYDARVVSSVSELLEGAAELGVIVVASPNRFHAEHARAAVHAGVPVVVDKPFAVSVEEGEAVIAAAEQEGVPVTVFHNRRWDGDFRTVRMLVESGRLGTVTRFESRFERWRPHPKGGWREIGDIAEGAGLLYDLGSHLVDQALQLFGPVTEVYAQVDRRRDGVTADDDVFLALTHANGVRSHLWASAVASDLGPRFRVLGSTGAYVKYGLDGQEEALRSGGNPAAPDWGVEPEQTWGRIGTPSAAESVPTLPGAYPAFYAQLVDALRGQGAMPVDPRDAVAGLRILEAARRSHAERTVVSLPVPVGHSGA